MDFNYYSKYLKYKSKYFKLKELSGGLKLYYYSKATGDNRYSHKLLHQISFSKDQGDKIILLTDIVDINNKDPTRIIIIFLNNRTRDKNLSKLPPNSYKIPLDDNEITIINNYSHIKILDNVSAIDEYYNQSTIKFNMLDNTILDKYNKLDKNIIYNLSSYDDVILHQQTRVDELDNILHKHPSIKVQIVGINGNGFLNNGIINNGWNHKQFLNMFTNITKLFFALKNKYPNRVFYGKVGYHYLYRDDIKVIHLEGNNNIELNPKPEFIHVWSASIDNFNQINDTEIIDKFGQGILFDKQLPGVFGIVTIPVEYNDLFKLKAKSNYVIGL